MKLLIYGLNFWPELTGVGKYSGEMAAWLSTCGHEVEVVTAPPYYPEWAVHAPYSAARWTVETWHPDGVGGPAGAVAIHRCPIWVPRRVGTLSRLLHLASFALSSLTSVAALVWRRPDVMLVVAPTLMTAVAASFLARWRGVPVWLHVQDFEVDAMFSLVRGDGASSSLWRRAALGFEQGLLRRFDRVSTISPRMLERLLAKGVMPARAVLFPNWVDLAAVHPMPPGANHFRRQWADVGAPLIVLYAGNMGEKQGLELLLAAARVLRGDAAFQFVLAGEGSARARLQAAAADLPNVRWLGLQPSHLLNELLNAADIHVLPQRADAADLVMPSKLTGMLASGRATIGTAAIDTQLGQVLDAAGRRVEAGAVEPLVHELRKLAADPALRLALGRRAREYAEAHFSQSAIMGRLEVALVELASPAMAAAPQVGN